MRTASILSVLVLAYSGACFAALGGAPQDFGAQTTTQTTATSAGGASYVVRDTTLASGTQVREYVADGVVFAVSWDGPALPDLKALLGKYFDTMVAEAAKAPLAGRGALAIDLPEVVIHSGGHMRAFDGNAWIPALLPAGFTAADVR